MSVRFKKNPVHPLILKILILTDKTFWGFKTKSPRPGGEDLGEGRRFGALTR